MYTFLWVNRPVYSVLEKTNRLLNIRVIGSDANSLGCHSSRYSLAENLSKTQKAGR